MKTFIPMLIIFLAVGALCVWDGIFTQKFFDKMENETSEIYTTILTTDALDENLKQRIDNLNDYWMKNMDILAISISRKDMQPVSDYLQYLYASVINDSKDDALTYSRLLAYNVEGLSESTGITALNLL